MYIPLETWTDIWQIQIRLGIETGLNKVVRGLGTVAKVAFIYAGCDCLFVAWIIIDRQGYSVFDFRLREY